MADALEKKSIAKVNFQPVPQQTRKSSRSIDATFPSEPEITSAQDVTLIVAKGEEEVKDADDRESDSEDGEIDRPDNRSEDSAPLSPMSIATDPPRYTYKKEEIGTVGLDEILYYPGTPEALRGKISEEEWMDSITPILESMEKDYLILFENVIREEVPNTLGAADLAMYFLRPPSRYHKQPILSERDCSSLSKCEVLVNSDVQAYVTLLAMPLMFLHLLLGGAIKLLYYVWLAVLSFFMVVAHIVAFLLLILCCQPNTNPGCIQFALIFWQPPHPTIEEYLISNLGSDTIAEQFNQNLYKSGNAKYTADLRRVETVVKLDYSDKKVQKWCWCFTSVPNA
jgi:hypothetical protein